MGITSLVASLLSIALSAIAIWLSVHFYTQGKNTEQRVTNALEGIRAQTDALQRLTGRHMDRLIRGVTEQDPSQSTLILAVVQALREIPSIASQLHGTSPSATAQVLANEAILGYIGIYYYSGIANVAWQYFLPPLHELQTDNAAKILVDQTCSDFRILETLISKIDPSTLQSSQLYHLYLEAYNRWKPYVKDSTMVYQERGEIQS